MPLAPLPPTTVKLIGSSQVITCVSSVIKELIENSIDSGAQHIEIKLDKHGLEKIEVKDDGCGIGKSDATVMCLPNYTSKLLDFSDLDNLTSYGFRGEALSSLCNVALVTITTKTAEDDVATCYTYDHNGQVTCSKISHISKGTIVTVTDLFKNLPVRKQFVSSSKRAAEELKRVEKVVKSLGMVHPRLRVTLIHNKFLIWQKTSVANLRQSVMQVLNLNIVKRLHHILHTSDQIRVEMLVPKRDSDVSSMCFSNFTDAYFLFINNRPVRSKEIEKAVYNKLFEFFGVYVPANKYPVCVTCLTLPPGCLDVNLEPNKTRVYFKNHDEVLDFVKQCMHIYYGEGKKEEEANLPTAKLPKKRKVEEEYPLDPKKVNLEHNENNVIVEANCQSLEQDIKCPDTVICLGESQSSSETVTCSGESTSKQESEASNKDVDCIFEQFCLENKKESPFSVQNCSIDKVPLDVVPRIGSESSSPKMYSIFFPRANNEPILSENESTVTSYKYLNSCLNQKQNKDQDINSELETKENNNISVKKMVDCLKKASEVSSTLNKIQTMDAYLSKNNQPLVMEDEAAVNFVEQNNLKNNNGGCDSELCEQKEEESTNKIQKLSVDLCSPTLSQWSKGAVVNPTGDQVQGPCLLGGRQEPESPNSSQELSNRSVSSQMGCKEMSAFTKFARKMRKAILEEQPELVFTKVAQMLQVQWRHLDVDEKKKYEDTVKIKKSPCSMHSSKQKPISAFMSSTPNIELEISMEKIRQMVKEPIREAESGIRLVGQLEASPLWLYHRQDSGVFILSVTRLLEAVRYHQREAESGIRLVGQLEASPLWLYHRQDSGVFILSVTRLLEAVRYHQHLAEFALPSKLLNDNITITPSDLSAAEWELLLSLERSPSGVVKDERFTSNGLLIEIAEGDVEAHLSYVPQNIAYCGVEEVQEILNMLLTHGLGASPAQCRPLKVISFIRSEVMRGCSSEDPPSQPEQVSELLSYWLSCVSSESQDCIHYRPVTQSLYSP